MDLPAESSRPQLPPGPSGHWLFGMLKERRADPLGLYARLLQYGDIVRFRVGPRHVVAPFEPDAVKRVLVDNAGAYSKGLVAQAMRGLLGQGLLTSEGELWKRQRRLMQPAFHRERLARLAPAMIAATRATLDRWEGALQRGLEVNVAAEMMRLTLSVAGRTLFAADVAGEADEVGRALTDAMEEENRRALSLVRAPPFVPTWHNRRRNAALGALDRVVYQLIADRRAGRTRGDDLLQMLVEARDEETGQPMEERQLRDEVMTLFLAGHETTANALAWTFYLLAQHPEVTSRLEAEVDSVLGGREPSPQDVPALPYVNRVIEESMRLYPPAWMMIRQAMEEDVLAGHRVRRGDIVTLCIWAIHRNPRLWEEPERFDPERFTPERSQGRSRYAYLPFGIGQRMCIGSNFALLEAALVLSMVAQRFRLSLVPGQQVVPLPLITLRPRDGIRMTLQRRQGEGRV